MGQDKLIPPLALEAACIITGSEQILRDYASASSLTATDIKRLIEDVLHNPVGTGSTYSYQYLLLHTRTYWYVLVCTMSWYVLVHGTHMYIPVCTGLYLSIPVHTSTSRYMYIPVHTCMY